MATQIPQLFGVVPTGSPLITTPASAPSPTSLLFTLPPVKFNHLTVFLLPGAALPPNTAAAVYIASPPSIAGAAPDFKFLGGIGPGKESAVYKVGGVVGTGGNGDAQSLILGISIEAGESVASRMAELASSNQANSTALVRQPEQKTQALVLAQRIIKNAFNFLASFSGNVPIPGAPGNAGMEVVPLKAFEDWWKKFESKVKNDPSFLEKDVD